MITNYTVHLTSPYLPRYNRRFAVAPAQSVDLHRPTPPIRELEGALCLKTTRCLRKDFTLVQEGQLYQIRNTVRASHILVEHQLDGTMRLTHQGRALDFHTITARPVAEAKPLPRAPRPVTPKPTHPWRTWWRQEREQHAAAAGT